MFFGRAADDNNISLRSTIPSLIGLAFFSGKIIEKLKGGHYLVIITIFLLTLPTTLYGFFQRASEQFTFNNNRLNPIYREIDDKTPLNSIIFNHSSLNSFDISVLAHRLSFKNTAEFNPTDKEYSALSKIARYKNLPFSNLVEIKKFMNEITKSEIHLKNYKYYLISENNENLTIVSEVGGYKLYAL